MDYFTQSIAELGISLSQLAVKGTATAVAAKIKAAKNEKDAEKIRNVYNEIISEILNERDEAIHLAQAYKSELERISISDEDINHLNATATRLLDVLKKMSPGINLESLEAFKDLISVDTLKSMQLLGFNYKAAIGEPLTKICSDAIINLPKKKASNTKK